MSVKPPTGAKPKTGTPPPSKVPPPSQSPKRPSPTTAAPHPRQAPKKTSSPILTGVLLAAVAAGTSYLVWTFLFKRARPIMPIDYEPTPQEAADIVKRDNRTRRNPDGSPISNGDSWVGPAVASEKVTWQPVSGSTKTATMGLVMVGPGDISAATNQEGVVPAAYTISGNHITTMVDDGGAGWGMSNFLDMGEGSLMDPIVGEGDGIRKPPVMTKAPPTGPPEGPNSTPPEVGIRNEADEAMKRWIINNYSITPADLAKTNCSDRENAVLVGGLPPSSTVLADAPKLGYCIQKCDFARSEQIRLGGGKNRGTVGDEKFDVEKVNGSFRVDYELVLWINPAGRQTIKGYRWYCRAKAPRGDDTWTINETGFYHRRSISPVFLNSTLDVFMDRIEMPKPAPSYNVEYNMKRDHPVMKAMYLRLCAGWDPNGKDPRYRSRRRMGRFEGDSGDPDVYIGKAKKNYTYYDFQMIGSYCYNVGRDTGGGDHSSDASQNSHGDFAKVPLVADQCVKHTYKSPNILPDGQNQVYKMRLTPGDLQCYACPNMYEALRDGTVKEITTELKGTDDDGYRCVRPCPPQMRDNLTPVGADWCLPIGIQMQEFTANVQPT